MKKDDYRYNLIFDGKLREGYEYEAVKRCLRDEVQLNEEQIITLFKGNMQVCTDTDYETARTIHKKFFDVGLDLKLKIHSTQDMQLPSLQPTLKSTVITLNRPVQVPAMLKQALHGKRLSCGSLHIGTIAWVTMLLGLCMMAVLYGALVAAPWLAAHALVASKAGFWSLVAYAPAALLSLFMLKPWFTPYPREYRLMLQPHQYYDLHAAIYKVCDFIGAPRPQALELDCGITAGSRLHWRFVPVLKKSVTVNLGLTLLGSVNVEQLCGAVVRTCIFNRRRRDGYRYHAALAVRHWLYTRAYGKDSWQQNLAQRISGRRAGIMRWGMRLMRVSMTLLNYYLRLLYKIYHASSSALFAAFERYADACEAQLIGARAAEQFRQLRAQLVVANVKLEHILPKLQSAGVPPENLPAVLRRYLPPQQYVPHDTESSAILSCAFKADSLLPHYHALCYYCTLLHYHQRGLAEAILSADKAGAINTVQSKTARLIHTFYNGLFSMQRFMQLDDAGLHGVVGSHQDVVDQIRWKSMDFKHLLDARRDLIRRYKSMLLGREYVKAGVRQDPAKYYLRKADKQACDADLKAIENKLLEKNQQLQQLDKLVYARIVHCAKKMSDAQVRYLRDSLKSLKQLHSLSASLHELDCRLAVLWALLIEPHKNLVRKMHDSLLLYTGIINKQLFVLVHKYPELNAQLDGKIASGKSASQVLDSQQCMGYGLLVQRYFYNRHLKVMAAIVKLCETVEQTHHIKPLRLV